MSLFGSKDQGKGGAVALKSLGNAMVANRTMLLKHYGTPLFALILCLVFGIFSENFLTSRNILTVLRQMAALVVLSEGFTFVTAVGGFDVGQGNTIGFINMIWFYVMVGTGSFPMTMGTALLVGGAIGLLNGWLTSYLKLPDYIITLSTGTVFQGIKLLMTGGTPITFPDDANKIIVFMGQGKIAGVWCSVVIMFAVVILTHWVLKKTKMGRRMYAIGGNMVAAKYSGINVEWYRCLAFIINGVLMGLASVLSTARLLSAQPLGGADMQMDILAAGFLSGTMFGEGEATGWGTFVGAFIMTMIINGMTMLRFAYYYQYIVKGAIVILAILMSSMQDTKLQRGA